MLVQAIVIFHQSFTQYNKSKFTASVSDALATLNNMDANGLADACAGVVAGGSSNLMTPMTNASGDKVVGFGHVLDRNELDAGAMVFGDGKILDLQSGFKNPRYENCKRICRHY